MGDLRGDSPHPSGPARLARKVACKRFTKGPRTARVPRESRESPARVPRESRETIRGSRTSRGPVVTVCDCVQQTIQTVQTQEQTKTHAHHPSHMICFAKNMLFAQKYCAQCLIFYPRHLHVAPQLDATARIHCAQCTSLLSMPPACGTGTWRKLIQHTAHNVCSFYAYGLHVAPQRQ